MRNTNLKLKRMKALTFTLLFLTFSVVLFASQEKKTLKLRLQSPTGNTDETTLYFDQGILPAYNIHQDAAYVFNNIPGIPEIYSYTLDKVACSINGCGTLQKAQKVNLGYQVGAPGNYTINATLVSNFDPTTLIRLIDNKMGDTIDLRENFYQVQLDSSDITTNRFQVLVSSAVKYSSTNANCANTGGTITITPDSTITWNKCQLMDSFDNVLQTYSDVRGPITFAGLAEGNYHVVYTFDQYTATNYFYLSGNYVAAEIGVPAQPIFTNQDVIFSAITTNANQFTWDFGDSTLINGVAHPTQRYLTPGTYTVTLFTSNSMGCSASAQATVIVVSAAATGINEPGKGEISVIAEGKVINVNIHDALLNDNSQILVYNLLGQAINAQPLTSQTVSINLENQANGYYLVSIRNGGTINTKRVFIGK